MSLKENETQNVTWWYVKRTSKSIFCSNGHTWRRQNNWVLLIFECKYCLLQNANSVYSESPFCLKVLIPPAKRWPNCAQCREHYVHTGIWHKHACSPVAFDFAAWLSLGVPSARMDLVLKNMWNLVVKNMHAMMKQSQIEKINQKKTGFALSD